MIICVFCLWPSRKGKRVIFVWLYNELYWGGVTSLNLWEPPGSCPSEFHTRANPPRHYWHWENLLDVEVPHQCTLHNVYIGQYVYLATEQAETYFKICFLICHLTYISEGIIYYSVALPAMCAAVVQIWRTCNVTGGGAVSWKSFCRQTLHQWVILTAFKKAPFTFAMVHASSMKIQMMTCQAMTM